MSGHGLLDLGAYEQFLSGEMLDSEPSDEESARADQIGRVAVHLIDCVVDVSNLLAENPDLDTARAALGSARSAVVAATCAVRHTHDRVKTATT